MKKDILAKAIHLADKSRVRPEKVVVAKPTSTLFVKKSAADTLSERLYTRLTPREMKRLRARVGTMFPISELLRNLVIQYLDKNDRDHGRD
jgi:hypothetical protein